MGRRKPSPRRKPGPSARSSGHGHHWVPACAGTTSLFPVSRSENRFLLLGMSSDARLLLVCHCEREEGEVIRIISARRATRRESSFYQGA
ncbi:MAG: BrnT family toxin [Lysobacterales bacterium]